MVYANRSANGFRLPTEAEWEYSCRAGSTGAYSGPLASSAWYYDNSGNNTQAAGLKSPNPWGLFDMHGNVWEWCWDGYGAYTTPPKTDPEGASDTSQRVLRGGSWGFSGVSCRSANRASDVPGYRFNDVGFRVVLNAEVPPPPVPQGFVLIPAGSFQMGDAFAEGPSNERPVHTVTVSAFFLQARETTKAEWDVVYTWALANGYAFDDSGQGKQADHPVHSISWYDVVKWCNARSEKDGLVPCYYTDAARTQVYKAGQVKVTNDQVLWTANGYRLPTEAEWEKAARGGLDGKRFPWGDTITHSLANYESNSDFAYDTSPTRGYHPAYESGDWPYTSPVGSFAPNGYGLYDMTGNVMEWCWDWNSSSYYTSGATDDPRGPSSGLFRVLRGGSWMRRSWFCRVAYRSANSPAGWLGDDGFRPARGR